MTFDEAYKRMREGAAIARPGWKKVRFLFWAHGYVRALHYSGLVYIIGTFAGPQDQDDWFIVGAPIPEVAPPKPKRPEGRRPFARNLAERQAEMKSRHIQRPWARRG